jgi:thioredoxin-like negative regulator of GroEL
MLESHRFAQPQCPNYDPSPLIILALACGRCGPCTLVSRELAKLVALRRPDSFQVLVLDVDADVSNSTLASELGITSLPTLVFVGE